MQILAMLTMLADHVGLIFFPSQTWLRVIGRLALPLYVFFLLQGMAHTRDWRRYALRLALVGLVAQWPFELTVGAVTGAQHWNAAWALLVCLLALRALDTLCEHNGQRLLIVAAAAWLLEAGGFDYGFYTLALALIYRAARVPMQLLLHALLTLALVLAQPQQWLQFFSLFGTLLIGQRGWLKALQERRAPRWLWWSFYPGHLALLALLRALAA